MELLVHILGLVALLLWGVRMIRTGITRAFGGSLRKRLTSGMRNRWRAAAMGAGVTMLTQSSTATGLIMSSLAGRGLVAVAPACAVMLGADLGSAAAAIVLSLNLGMLAPLAIFGGVVTFMTAGRTRRRDLGRTAIGLGLVLTTLGLLAQTASPLRDSEVLTTVLGALGSEVGLAILLSAALTWLSHSSLAMVLFYTSLAASGTLDPQLGLELVVGANLGAAIPALVATLGQSPEARRVPLANALFRVAGAILMLPLLPWVHAILSTWIANPAREVVLFHLLFNVALFLVFIWFTTPMERLLRYVITDVEKPQRPETPRFLDRDVLDTPPVALALAARESLRLGDKTEEMIRAVWKAMRDDDRKLAQSVAAMDDVVDSLHESIKLYCTEISREELDAPDSRRCTEVIIFATNMEHVGDTIDRNMANLAQKKIHYQLSFSDEGWAEINSLFDMVLEDLRLAMSVFMSDDIALARKLITRKDEFRTLAVDLQSRHFERLRSGLPETLETSSMHIDILRDLKQINTYVTAIAYPLLEAAGELSASRLKPRETRRAAEG